MYKNIENMRVAGAYECENIFTRNPDIAGG